MRNTVTDSQSINLFHNMMKASQHNSDE